MRWVIIFLMFHSGYIFAWGDLGHETICRMALEELTPSAKVKLESLIDLDDFPHSCTFADHPRQNAPGHFLNLPRSAMAVSVEECPMASDCLFTALAEDLEILKDESRSKEARLRSLKLLGHWVGDIHQPLHVSFMDDRGGNEIKERGGPCQKTLHSAWDTCIIKERIGNDFVANAATLHAQITDAERQAWLFDSAAEWADESFQITLSSDVQYCVRKNGACWYAEDNMILERDVEPIREVTIDHAYLDAHADTIRLRLNQAAVRLAAVLNSALVDGD